MWLFMSFLTKRRGLSFSVVVLRAGDGQGGLESATEVLFPVAGIAEVESHKGLI